MHEQRESNSQNKNTLYPTNWHIHLQHEILYNVSPKKVPYILSPSPILKSPVIMPLGI